MKDWGEGDTKAKVRKVTTVVNGVDDRVGEIRAQGNMLRVETEAPEAKVSRKQTGSERGRIRL